MELIDINENYWSEDILNILLIDNTTNKNIIWATADYEYKGKDFEPLAPIDIKLIRGINSSTIKPRSLKSFEKQISRTRDKAEVHTPSWICNKQNNLIDDAWFGRKNVFNYPDGKKWETTKGKIRFPNKIDRTWKDYVDEKRLEIACGEAPYLVSRYDSVTGELIDITKRIGLLDRKLRIVSENVIRPQEWKEWAKRAIQSVYGFDFQGDSLFLARENILATYIDYYCYVFNDRPSEADLIEIARVISWNIWQMDGLTCAVPYSSTKKKIGQLDLFSTLDEDDKPFSLIKDWSTNETIEFKSLFFAR